MALQASKTLSAIAGAGFFPRQITSVGPYDEGPALPSAGPTINRTSKPGANRVLACEFEPLGEQNEKAATTASINGVVAELGAKVAGSDEKMIGRARAHFADLRFTNPGGTALSVQLAVFALEGIVYRFTLSAIESKAAEMRAVLEGCVKTVAG